MCGRKYDVTWLVVSWVGWADSGWGWPAGAGEQIGKHGKWGGGLSLEVPDNGWEFLFSFVWLALANVHIAQSMPRICKSAYFNSANSERGPTMYNMQNPRRAGEKGETVYIQSDLTTTDPVVTETGYEQSTSC